MNTAPSLERGPVRLRNARKRTVAVFSWRAESVWCRMRAPSLLALCLLGVSACATEVDHHQSAQLAQHAEAPASTPIPPSGNFRVAPARPEESFLRCGTRAGENRWSSSLSADHRRVLAHTNAGTVRLIATERWEELAELASPSGRIEAAAFSPDGTLLATTSEAAGQLTLWRADDGSFVRSFLVRPPSLDITFWSNLTFSPDGRYIVTALQTVTDLVTGETRDWKGATATLEKPVVDANSPGPQRWVAGGEYILSYDRYWAAGASVYAQLSWTRRATGEQAVIFRERATQPPTSTYALSPTGLDLAMANSYEGVVMVALGSSTRTLVTSKKLQILGFSADGGELYMATGGAFEVWDARTRAQLRSFPWPAQARYLGLAPDGSLVIATNTESSWWDPQTGERVRTLPFALLRASWSADGAYGVGETNDTLLVAWAEADGTILRRVPRPTVTLPVLAWNGSRVRLTTEFPVALRAGSFGHFQATDWYGVQVLDRATGRLLREFPMTNSPNAELELNGARLLTLERDQSFQHTDPYVAVWCR